MFTYPSGRLDNLAVTRTVFPAYAHVSPARTLMIPTTDGLVPLRRILQSGQHNDVNQMIRDQQTVIDTFGSAFLSPDTLDEGTLTEFLRFEHNRHWWNLHRDEEKLMRHFDVVRTVLGELMNSEIPIGVRIDGIGDLPGFTTDLYTAILLVAHPDEFGVRSRISDSAMRRLDLWPSIEDDASAGEAYEAVNEMLHVVAAELDTDLWTLDALWWGVEKEHDPTKHFVTRKRAPSTPKRRTQSAGTAKPSAARAMKPPAPETFMCANCFATKPVRLSSDTPGWCVDCA